MPYYSCKKEIIDTQKFQYFDQGGCAVVYRNGDTLLKIYNETCKKRHRINKRMFKTIKTSNIPNMVKLYDYYYEEPGLVGKFSPIDAYTMEMAKGKKIDLLEQKRDYLKDMIDQLENVIDRLVELKVVIEDPTSKNIIFTDQGPLILDPDQFLHMPLFTRKFLYELNKEKMIIYINRTIDDSIGAENAKHVFCGFDSSLTRDFNEFLTEETINETIQKKVLKSI